MAVPPRPESAPAQGHRHSHTHGCRCLSPTGSDTGPSISGIDPAHAVSKCLHAGYCGTSHLSTGNCSTSHLSASCYGIDRSTGYLSTRSVPLLSGTITGAELAIIRLFAGTGFNS